MAQLPLPDPELEATNGLMLRKLLTCASYQKLPPPPAQKPAWQSLLRFAVERGASALIDVGGMLAGVELEDAAAHLLQLLFKSGHALQAVVFFQRSDGLDGGAWVLRDAVGRQWCAPAGHHCSHTHSCANMPGRCAARPFGSARC